MQQMYVNTPNHQHSEMTFNVAVSARGCYHCQKHMLNSERFACAVIPGYLRLSVRRAVVNSTREQNVSVLLAFADVTAFLEKNLIME